MARIQPPSTLGEYRESHYYLWASCEVDLSCTHYGRVDTDRLIAVLGADFKVVQGRERLMAALRCSRCGRRGGASIRMGLDDQPSPGGSHGLSRTR